MWMTIYIFLFLEWHYSAHVRGGAWAYGRGARATRERRGRMRGGQRRLDAARVRRARRPCGGSPRASGRRRASRRQGLREY